MFISSSTSFFFFLFLLFFHILPFPFQHDNMPGNMPKGIFYSLHVSCSFSVFKMIIKVIGLIYLQGESIEWFTYIVISAACKDNM